MMGSNYRIFTAEGMEIGNLYLADSFDLDSLGWTEITEEPS